MNKNFLLLTIVQAFFFVSCSKGATKNTNAPTPNNQEQAENKEVTKDSILSLTIYEKDDSAKVESLLRMDTNENDILFYARQFKGLPYIASTLEKADPERLVVNLRQFDCTTLVETVIALALTKRQGRDSFSAYCHNLMLIRYWGGKMDGYLSRLHYFTWWMHDNINKGLFTDISDATHFTQTINVRNHYMSKHPEKYKFLKGNTKRIKAIQELEEKYNGSDGKFLPAKFTNLSKEELSCIHDGDVIAIVSEKDGIDYSHLGFAVWGKDNKLHLLNASSIHHKVVEEPKTLFQYLKEHPKSIGIRLLRLN